MARRFELSALLVLCVVPASSCVEETPDLFPGPEPPMFDPSALPPDDLGSDLPVLAAGGSSNDGSGTSPGSSGNPGSPSPAEAPGVLPVDGTTAPPGGGQSPVPPGADPSVPPTPTGPVVEADPTGGARLCAAPAQLLLLDFEVAPNDPNQAVFGDFSSTFSGGTYIYPVRSAAGDPAALGLVSAVVAGGWSISGTVRDPSGFGVFFDCQQLDASAFGGIAFSISGNVERGGEVVLVLSTAANEVARSWFVQTGNGSAAASFGRCFPVTEQFDGTCQSARITIPVSAEPQDVIVRFADLTGGSPEVGVNPAELTKLAWELPSAELADAGGLVPYSVGLVVDDIRFVAP